MNLKELIQPLGSGLGYIVDGAAYSQDAVFKKQMDSAGLAFDNKLKQGISGYWRVVCLKPKGPSHGSLVTCMMAMIKSG